MHEGLFISYRRSDSQSATGRLADHLRQNGFGGERDMFLDIDQRIPPGMDFRVVINETLAGCDLVIVVIGPRWLDASDGEGRRRLDRTSDTHRLEVAAALNSAARVIPVLVEGAAHPAEEKLPDSLKDLAYLQSWSLGERNYAGDVESLAHEMLDARRQMEDEREQAAAEEAEREQAAAAEKEREDSEHAEAAAAEKERERLAAEAAAAEKARQRLAAEEAEREQAAAAEKERERLAAEQAEGEQAAAAENQRERLAAGEAERAQVAAAEQEGERLAAEAAAAEKARQDRERAEAAAAEQKRERLAAEAAAVEQERERVETEKSERGRVAAEEELEQAAEEAERAQVAAAAEEDRQQGKRDETAADELARLSALHDQGTLTDEEYAAIVAKEAAADQLARLSALHDQGTLTDEEYAAGVAKEKALRRRLVQEARQSPPTGSSEDGEAGLSHRSRPNNVGIMLRITEIGMKWVIPGLLALWLGLLLIGTIRGYPVLVTTSDDFHRDPTWGSWFIAAFIAVIVGGLSFLGGWAVSRYRNSDPGTTELLPRTRPDDLVGIMLRITEIGMKWVIPGLLALWLGLVLIGTIRGYAVLVWTADDFDRSHSNHDSGSGLLNPVWGSWFIAVIAGGLSFLGGWAVSKYGKGRQ